MAEAAEVDERTIQRIEQGENSPTADTLQALARAYDMEVTQLLTGFTRESLAAFESEYLCPHCGSKLIERTFVPHEYGDTELEVFECGYTQGWKWQPCPSDPRFPKFEDFDLHFHQERDGRWFCQAIGKTEISRTILLNAGCGKSKEDAEELVRYDYINIRYRYDATSGKQIEPNWLTRILDATPPSLIS